MPFTEPKSIMALSTKRSRVKRGSSVIAFNMLRKRRDLTSVPLF